MWGIPAPVRDSTPAVRTLTLVSSPSDERAALAHLDSVSVRAGSVHILRSIDLRIEAGEAIGVFGANGAGKTTLLRLLATVQPPAGGDGHVLGARLGSDERFDVRPRIGYVGHTPGLYPELTLHENLRFVADAQGIDREAVDRSLTAVGLGGAVDRHTDRCSHGMQRRAEFARILMTRPTLLLLDEPHSALDGDAVDIVDELVRLTTNDGGAAVLVSHDRQRVRGLADRTVEITGGTLA